MNEERIPIGEATVLVIRNVAGHLELRGGQEEELRVRAGGELQIDAGDEEIALTCSGDCVLALPTSLNLRCEAVHGHAQIEDLTGAVTGDAVDGHLRLRNVGPVRLAAVRGNLDAEGVSGDLIVDSVGGGLRAAGMRGRIAASIGGDLSVRDLDGSVQAEAGGDARLDFVAIGVAQNTVSAGGDIVCRMPAEASATVSLQCGGRVYVQGPIALQPQAAGAAHFVLGEGEATVELRAGGDIRVRARTGFDEVGADGDVGASEDFSWRIEQATQQIAAQLEGQLGVFARQIEERLIESGATEEIAARVQEKVQSALRRAETNIANALRHVEKQAQRAEERAARLEAHQMRRQTAWPAAPPPRGPRPAAVTPEQRMRVLNMLNDGKITVEQAEQLLAALAGKGD